MENVASGDITSRVFTFAGLINNHQDIMIGSYKLLSAHDFIIGLYTIVTAIVVLVLAFLATQNMKKIPSGIQNLYEYVLSGILLLAKDVVGEKIARKYFPLTATIALFVFFANVIGIIPGFESPSSSWSFTLTLALVVFVYYHFEGIRAQGVVKYFAHFLGPVKALIPIMLPVEIISHFSRIVSLSFRLFGSIKGDDMFLLVMLMLAPWIIPMLPFAILTFMALIQAFVFMILTYVYLGGAVAAEEH